MLIVKPEPTDSADPDDVSIATSAAVPMSGTKLLAQPDDSRFLADNPLIISRPSSGRLPCTENTVMFMFPVPPTSCWLPPLKLVSVTPGTSTATAYWLRPAGSADT